MKCLIKNKQCKFWNEVIGCDDVANIEKCDEVNNDCEAKEAEGNE